jgi:hypothetical protein
VAKLLRPPDTSWVQRKIALTVRRNSAPPVAAAELTEGTLSTSITTRHELAEVVG